MNREELISWESSLHKRDLKYQIETFIAKPFVKRRSRLDMLAGKVEAGGK